MTSVAWLRCPHGCDACCTAGLCADEDPLAQQLATLGLPPSPCREAPLPEAELTEKLPDEQAV